MASARVVFLLLVLTGSTVIGVKPNLYAHHPQVGSGAGLPVKEDERDPIAGGLQTSPPTGLTNRGPPARSGMPNHLDPPMEINTLQSSRERKHQKAQAGRTSVVPAYDHTLYSILNRKSK